MTTISSYFRLYVISGHASHSYKPHLSVDIGKVVTSDFGCGFYF